MNVVVSLCDSGDLKGHIDRNRPLSEPAVCAILVPLMHALHFLHVKPSQCDAVH